MKSKIESLKLRLLALTLIASPMAMAQDSGWYLGANLGQSKAKIDDVRITSGLLGAGFTTTSIKDGDKDLGFKLFAGYQFNKYLALEGGYFDLGKFDFTAVTVPTGTLDGEIKLKGVNFDLVLSLPFTENFSGFGRVGANYAEAKDTFVGTGSVNVLDPNLSARGTNVKFGFGFQYDFTKAFGMRAEAERYRINDAVGTKGDVDLLSVGVLVRFGRKAPAPQTRARAELAPVSPDQAPIIPREPMMVIVPVAAKTQQYCTILDLTFDIDRDTIEREDKEKLAVIGTFLTKYPNSTTVIEGHTDNVGNPDHNLKLSQDRALSVVTYLVDTLRIDRSRLTAVGYGDSRPVGDNNTEEGKRQNRRINAVVACVTDIEGLTVAPARMTVAMDMEFDQNSANVRPEYREELNKVAKFMKANPTVTATVEGHTGNLQATSALANEISQRRAQSVVEYLVQNFNIDRSRLSAEGYGKTRLFAYNTTAEGKQENRRVNIIINYPKK
jgi:OOP family OmpA-OmpF porin